ncbi:hypothetical protein [Mesorhizobium tamadayense]|uniref:hypothetical protein n=1 Tax=Mesorhizobium tamadayense TaxID=425306 RepID=UPI0026813BC4
MTEERISVSIPSYGFPHSIVDRTSKVKKGQPLELVGDVTHIDGDWVTVNLGIPVTVNMDTLRLVTAYKLQAAHEENAAGGQADLNRTSRRQ